MERGGISSASCDKVDRGVAAFVAGVTPFELGFMETDVESMRGLVLARVNRLVDSCVDILMQMNTSCVDGAGRVVFAFVVKSSKSTRKDGSGSTSYPSSRASSPS